MTIFSNIWDKDNDRNKISFTTCITRNNKEQNNEKDEVCFLIIMEIYKVPVMFQDNSNIQLHLQIKLQYWMNILILS